MELAPEVQAVREAIQNLINALSALDGEPQLLDSAVVIWEAVAFSDDGDVERQIRYTVPTDNFSMSAVLGLLEAGKHYIRRDIFGTEGHGDESR